MEIQILVAESMGARSMACLVRTARQNICIDPGIALDQGRFRLFPHPFQIAIAQKLRARIQIALMHTVGLVK